MAAKQMLEQLAKFASVQGQAKQMQQYQQMEQQQQILQEYTGQTPDAMQGDGMGSAEDLLAAAQRLETTPDMNSQMGTYSTGEHFFMTAAGPMRASDHGFRGSSAGADAPLAVKQRLERYDYTQGRVGDPQVSPLAGGFGAPATKSTGTGYAQPSTGGGLAKAQKRRQDAIASNPMAQEYICSLHGEVRTMGQLVPAPDGSGRMICTAASPCLDEPEFKKQRTGGIEYAITSGPNTAYFPNGKPAQEGDWYCPGCKDLQYSKNTVCRMCGTPQPTGEEVTSVQIVGLPKDFTESKVREVFGRYAVIKSCNLQMDDVDYVSAIIGLKTPDAAKWLIDNVNNNIPMGMNVPVKIAFVPTFIQAGTTLQAPSERPSAGVQGAFLMCSIHSKPRTQSCLVPLNDGTNRLRCAEGNECRGSGTGATGRRMCMFFESGHCSKGDMCPYAHGEFDTRELKKLKKCAFFDKGECKNGDRCAFAHGDDELHVPVCPISGKQVPQFGDWWCPGCGGLQFAKNASCRRCLIEKPDGAPTVMPQGLLGDTSQVAIANQAFTPEEDRTRKQHDFRLQMVQQEKMQKQQFEQQMMQKQMRDAIGQYMGQNDEPQWSEVQSNQAQEEMAYNLGMQMGMGMGMPMQNQMSRQNSASLPQDKTKIQQLEFEKAQMLNHQSEQERRLREMEQKMLAMQQQMQGMVANTTGGMGAGAATAKSSMAKKVPLKPGPAGLVKLPGQIALEQAQAELNEVEMPPKRVPNKLPGQRAIDQALQELDDYIKDPVPQMNDGGSLGPAEQLMMLAAGGASSSGPPGMSLKGPSSNSVAEAAFAKSSAPWPMNEPQMAANANAAWPMNEPQMAANANADSGSMGLAERLLAQAAGGASSSGSLAPNPPPIPTNLPTWTPADSWGADPNPQPRIPQQHVGQMALEQAAAELNQPDRIQRVPDGQMALDRAMRPFRAADPVPPPPPEVYQTKQPSYLNDVRAPLGTISVGTSSVSKPKIEVSKPIPAKKSSSLEADEYEVTLEGEDSEHGMTFKTAKDLRIKEIDGGLVEEYNLANPGNTINVGDTIIEVNGQRSNAAELLLALFSSLESNNTHKLRLRRHK